MILYPTIELQNGRCVSLIRGRIEEPELWHVDPLKKVQEFVAQGAEWIHVTDLDAVKGLNNNRALLMEIIKTAGVPVQLGGGFRSAARVDEWFALGAERIVIGTLGVQMPTVVKELVTRHPGKIALAVDVWKGKVLVDGWRTSSAYTPEGADRGLRHDALCGHHCDRCRRRYGRNRGVVFDAGHACRHSEGAGHRQRRGAYGG